MYITAIANQKGGVGKTTTCVNLAAFLVAAQRQVLVIDMDPQGNATAGSGISRAAQEFSAYDALMGKAPLEKVVQHCFSGYDIWPGGAEMTAAEVELLSLQDKESRLRFILREMEEKGAVAPDSKGSYKRKMYDAVLIDCPPALNLLTVNALVAAHDVLIPVQCEYYALEGISALLRTITRVKQYNPGLAILGVLRTMYDSRNLLDNQVTDQLNQHFGDQVLRTAIPRNIRLAEAPSHGKPILSYDRYSRGAEAYLRLAGELLGRWEERRQQEEARHSG